MNRLASLIFGRKTPATKPKQRKIRMTINYPAHGNGDARQIDTDSRALKNAADWIAKTIGASGWHVQFHFTSYAEVPDSAGTPGTTRYVVAYAVFEGLPPDPIITTMTSASCDLRGVLDAPEKIAADYVIHYNIPNVDLTKLKYINPDAPPADAKDWEVAGALIGPPLHSLPGCFQFRYNAQLGATFTGASGKRYRLVKIGEETPSFFDDIIAWKTIS